MYADFSLEEEYLFGSLFITIYGLEGLKQSAGFYHVYVLLLLPADQLKLAIPVWVGTLRTSKTRGLNSHTT